MKPRYQITRTYSTVIPVNTPEDYLDDFQYEEEHGQLEHLPAADLYDVVRALEKCSELSASFIHPGIWASFSYQDYHTGEDTTESVHVKHISGEELPINQLARIFRLAGLTA